MGKFKVYSKIAMNYLLAICIVLIIIFVVPKFISFFWPFVIGWIIAILSNPLVHFMEKKIKIVRKHSSAIIIIVVITSVTALTYIISITLIRELVSLSKNLPEIYANAEYEFQRAYESLQDRVDVLPDDLKMFLNNIGNNINRYVKEYIDGLDLSISNAGSVVKNVADGIVLAFITILSSYFFIAERDNIVEKVKVITPEAIQLQYRLIMDNLVTAVGGFIKAQLKIMVMIFFILLVGLTLLGIDYAVLIAFGIALLDFLPVFGAGAVIWPWALYNVIVGNYFHAVCLMVIYLGCQALRQIVQPKMVADSVGLSPLATLLFMFIGYRLNGVIGMIIGVPIGMVLLGFHKTGAYDNLIRGTKMLMHDMNEYRKF